MVVDIARTVVAAAAAAARPGSDPNPSSPRRGGAESPTMRGERSERNRRDD
jgi:hypothetical protein